MQPLNTLSHSFFNQKRQFLSSSAAETPSNALVFTPPIGPFSQTAKSTLSYSPPTDYASSHTPQKARKGPIFHPSPIFQRSLSPFALLAALREAILVPIPAPYLAAQAWQEAILVTFSVPSASLAREHTMGTKPAWTGDTPCRRDKTRRNAGVFPPIVV
jgi:hypothetical protein